MRSVIFTIGYERAAVPDFLSTLAEARIGVVADVRAIAHSRRAGFAKTALGLHLMSAGIGYWHLPALGDPKPGREAAWAGDDALFRAIFQAHLRTGIAVEALSQVASRAAAERICLLCLETEPELAPVSHDGVVGLRRSLGQGLERVQEHEGHVLAA